MYFVKDEEAIKGSISVIYIKHSKNSSMLNFIGRVFGLISDLMGRSLFIL
jgi:hypothetical protein